MRTALKKVLSDQFALLFLRDFRPDIATFRPYYFGWGLFVTWLAGIGRYWDHPNASWWQYLGLGSVIYVFVMADILWLAAAPIRPAHWRYDRVWLFVSLTSLPALLYAIPVEKFLSLPQAQQANVAFLATVALWRVILLFRFLRSSGKLSWIEAPIVALLPLVLIVAGLTALNLEKAVFDLMGGNRGTTANDGAYIVLLLITIFSVMASPVLILSYLALIYFSRKRPKVRGAAGSGPAGARDGG